MTAPIFIIGANRSGTTLLRLMLNAHSRIAIPEETIYFKSSIAGVSIDNWRAPGLSTAAYHTLVTSTLDANPTMLAHLNRSGLEAELCQDAPHDLRRPFALLLQRWAEAQGKARWGEKTPGNLFFVDVLLEMFPGAQFIHVVRDPRAGVASMQQVDFFPNSIPFNAMNRRKHDRVAERMRHHVPSTQWRTVLYEDLVADPESVLSALCSYLGETFEPAMLAFHRTSSQYMKSEAATSFNAAATQPVTDTMTEKWKAQLSPQDVAVIETVCTTELHRYGYVPTGARPSLTARLGLLAHEAYWWLQEWRNRHDREFTVKSPMFARSRGRLSARIRPISPSLATRLHP